MYIDTVSGDEFIKQRQTGHFYDVDPLKSNFVGHHLIISWKTRSFVHKKRVTLNSDFKDIITRKTNNGE
jgi:hypothetical protein